MTNLVSLKDLARTYTTKSYPDPWQAVEDYQRVLEYTAENPQKGSSAVSSALELPRGRVHPWMNGSRPAPVRAVQVAESQDWLPLTTEEDDAVWFTELVTWIFSRGSITEADYSPSFVCSSEGEQSRLGTVFNNLGITYDIYREMESGRSTEARISEYRSIVGRILTELGAPRGSPNTVTQIPSYLHDDPLTLQYVFATTYMMNASKYWEWRDGYIIRQDEYTDAYRNSLAKLFRRLSDKAAAHDIEVNPDSIFLPAAVVEEIRDSALEYDVCGDSTLPS